MCGSAPRARKQIVRPRRLVGVPERPSASTVRRHMSRAACIFPTKHELQRRTGGELNRYIRGLRDELNWRRTGPVHKSLIKRLEVAEKVRKIRRGREAAGDV